MKKECLILGGLVPDVYYSVSRWPDRGQDGFISDENVVVGGCAVNMAVTAENLGLRAHVVSCVGEDEIGGRMDGYLKEHGLSRRLIRRTEGVSGKCLVFVEPDGERTFLTRKGAEGLFPEDLAEAILQGEYAAAGVTGYYLLNDDAERIMAVIEELFRRGTKILFDPSPLADAIRPDILRRMAEVSHIMTPNVTELKVLEEKAGKRLISKGGVQNSLKDQICQSKAPVLIVKDGSAGGTVYTPERSFPYLAEKCTAVDTTGAGDSFSGALLYSMAEDIPVDAAVKLAARCAAKTVTIQGPHGFWKLEG